MEIIEQVRESTYAEYKAGFDKDMRDTTEGFVRIGYRLRMAEDTNILQESGYKSVAEFADAEYHLTKDQVSRFININKEFSEDGYSPRLKQEYSRFGFSKLAIMLTMNEETRAAIPEQATKAEIQELSREVKAEKEISDLEVMLEPKKYELETLENNLQKAVYQLYTEHPVEKYLATINALRLSGSEMKDKINAVYDALAPNGYMMATFRIPSHGKYMLSIKGKNAPVELVNVRMEEREKYSFEELVAAVLMFCPIGAADGRKAWEIVFGREFPVPEQQYKAAEKKEVAPEQPKQPEKKTFTAKEAAEQFAENMKEPPEAIPEPSPKAEELEYKEPEARKEEVINPPVNEPEEQIPGQTSLEADFREYLPDSMQQEKEAEAEVAPEQPQKTKKDELHEQIYKIVTKMQVKIMSKKYTETMELCQQMESLLNHMEELQSEV